jgi:septin family protein
VREAFRFYRREREVRMSRLQCVNVPGAGNLMTETCYKCQTLFAMSMAVYRTASERREDFSFYCPNGHRQNYITGQSETDRIRQERDRLKQETARLIEEAREAEEKAAKAERALKRHKKRAAAGTCPCCKRTFSALAEHMKRQHPGFVAESGAKVVPLKRA